MAWSVLQSANAVNDTGTGATTLSVTFGSNVSSGTKLIAYVENSDSTIGTTGSVKDGAGNSFTLASNNTAGANTNQTAWFLDTPAGDVGTAPTITATCAAAAYIAILVQEVSGLLAGNTTACIDGTPGLTHSSSGPPVYASTASNEYLVYIWGDDGEGVTATQPAGWTLDPHSHSNDGGGANLSVCYKNSTGGTETGAWTLGGTADNALTMFAFQLGGPVITSGPALSPNPMGSRPAMIVSAAGWRGAQHSR